MVHHADARRGQVARRGQRHADHAALGGAVGDLPDLAVVGGDRRGVDAHAALAVLERLVGQHGARREAQDVEGPDQVDGDDDREGLQRVGPARAGDLLREPGAGAAHADAQRRRRPAAAASTAACTWSSSRTSQATKAAPSSSASAWPFSALTSAIVSAAPCACRRRAVASPSPEAPPTTSAPLPSMSMARHPREADARRLAAGAAPGTLAIDGPPPPARPHRPRRPRGDAALAHGQRARRDLPLARGTRTTRWSSSATRSSASRATRRATSSAPTRGARS